MWEYYKAYCAKRPAYGKPAAVPYNRGSYVQQPHTILKSHLSDHHVDHLQHMKTRKTFCDVLCGWCVYWTQTRPPFLCVGLARTGSRN